MVELKITPGLPDEAYYNQDGTSATAELAGTFAPALLGIEEQILPVRPKINSGAFLAQFKTRVKFEEQGVGIKVRLGDTISRISRAGGDKYAREEKKGHEESASYGIAEIDGHKFVLYAMHWDYWAGTLGAVAGEKFVRATNLALKNKLPLFSILSSGGARVEEGMAALVQMPRVVIAADNLKKAKLPYAACLAGEVWGGISASGVTAADFINVIEGTNTGFPGPRVIENYTHQKVPPGAQSGEEQVRRRNLDRTMKAEELYDWLAAFLKAQDTRKISSNDLVAQISEQPNKPLIYRRFNELPKDVVDGEALYERYQRLLRNPNGLDTVSILRHAFTDVVPLYSINAESENMIEYPAIIAALGKIGPQTVLVIGNQPSYQIKSDGTIKKIVSSPNPSDYEYMVRMLELGKVLGIPAVVFCDTPGAKPTLEAEYADQSRKIENAIRASNTYPYPIISVVTGLLGSGGGIVSPIVDNIAALYKTLLCVLEPESAASIIDKTTTPTKKQVIDKIIRLGMIPPDALRDKLIDAIIQNSEDPLETIRAIRYYLAHTFHDLDRRSKRSLNKRRSDRMIKGFRGRQLDGTK